ncbi:unnamed protein product [Polarella glacialis]|uniref:Uncharacterized protein n=1 Tax=Polarella glacialis TaxID=89957 RepID=A0A813L6B0_POLGL|nr:unnamed protein product [Polarella glacialis]CAE8720541.1 unnamed protein product [Polarella glacialis]
MPIGLLAFTFTVLVLLGLTVKAVIVMSDGSPTRPHCSWNTDCTWDAASKTECAQKLCERSGFDSGTFVSASNDMCSSSYSGVASEYYLVDDNVYYYCDFLFEAQIQAECVTATSTTTSSSSSLSSPSSSPMTTSNLSSKQAALTTTSITTNKSPTSTTATNHRSTTTTATRTKTSTHSLAAVHVMTLSNSTTVFNREAFEMSCPWGLHPNLPPCWLQLLCSIAAAVLVVGLPVLLIFRHARRRPPISGSHHFPVQKTPTFRIERSARSLPNMLLESGLQTPKIRIIWGVDVPAVKRWLSTGSLDFKSSRFSVAEDFHVKHSKSTGSAPVTEGLSVADIEVQLARSVGSVVEAGGRRKSQGLTSHQFRQISRQGVESSFHSRPLTWGSSSIFSDGEWVEYFSTTHARWLPAMITGVGDSTHSYSSSNKAAEAQVKYDLELRISRQPRKGVLAELLRSPLKPGEGVEVWSRCQALAWVSATVVSQQTAGSTLLAYKVCLGEDAMDRFVIIPAEWLRRRFRPGSHVQVFRGLTLGWEAAVIQDPKQIKSQSLDSRLHPWIWILVHYVEESEDKTDWVPAYLIRHMSTNLSSFFSENFSI